MDNKSSVSLRLPWSPSANEIWRSLNGSYRPYLAPKYRKFLKEVKALYLAQGAPRFENKELLQVGILLFPPHNRSYDVDNRIKPTLDALTKCGLWIDDRYVRRLYVSACMSVEHGAIIVEVEPFEEKKELANAKTLASYYGLKCIDKETRKK